MLPVKIVHLPLFAKWWKKMLHPEDRLAKKRKEEEGEWKEIDHVVFFVFFSGSSRVNPDPSSISGVIWYLGDVGFRSVLWQSVVFVRFRAVSYEIWSGHLPERCR